jgi:hypothetical protein
MNKPSRQNLLLAFAPWIRTGLFGKRKPVENQSVEKALCHVA